MRFVLCTLLSIVCACGASAAQIKTARTSHYDVAASAVFEAAMAAAQENGGVAEHNAEHQALRTKSRSSGSHRLGTAFTVSLLIQVNSREGETWVEITPLGRQRVSGSPQPRELAPDHPATPGWVKGWIDKLYLAIHARLKAHALPPRAP